MWKKKKFPKCGRRKKIIKVEKKKSLNMEEENPLKMEREKFPGYGRKIP